MQMAFDFGAVQDIAWVREQLIGRFGDPGPILVRSPIGQMVKSSISSRTRDEVSLAAYHRLIDAYPDWPDITHAPMADIEAVIHDVTFPDVKARYVRDALGMITARHPDFDLAFLGKWHVPQALAWLERLPGVGRKVSASTLNFSTLRMPAFVIDTHILRVSRRFGFIRNKADTHNAYDYMMAMLHAWSAADLAELHIVMKHLGQTLCRADCASCPDCPISSRCQSAIAYPRAHAAIAAG